MTEFRSLHTSYSMPLMCLRLDVADWMNGDMSNKQFIEYARIDLKRLANIIDKIELGQDPSKTSFDDPVVDQSSEEKK